MKTIVTNHTYRILNDTDKTAAVYWGIQPGSKGQAERVDAELRRIMGNKSYTVIAYEIDDWFAGFSPWEAPAAFGDTDFKGCGKDTLNWLKSDIPEIERQLNITPERRIIAGYSLSGLFSLWALYESDFFDGAISCSGSLWFPGWSEYIDSHSITRSVSVYLSLGLKEEKTRNTVMAAVGDVTRKQYAVFNAADNVRCVLEWNQGGHFNNPELRMANGIAWAEIPYHTVYSE